MNFVEFNLNFNRQHINNILRYLIALFLLISTQLNFSQQEENKNEISIDTLEEKLLLDKVRRKAKGYIRINNKEKKIFLFDKAELYYQNIELKAGVIEFDWGKNIVSAGD